MVVAFRIRFLAIAVLIAAIPAWAQNFTITTVAGNGRFGGTESGDGGPAAGAELYGPQSTALDAAGNLYIADTFANRIRKVAPSGVITTFAGTGGPFGFGYSGDGGPSVNAKLNQPQGIALDTAGNLYIADYLNNVVRKVDAVGIISTVAGSGKAEFAGDGGPATNAGLAGPYAIAVDTAGNLYIAETARVRKVSAAGIITTVAGGGPAWNFVAGPMGDGGPAIGATLAGPQGIALDAAGNIYISDNPAQKVRKVSTAGVITTVAGNGVRGFTGGTFSGDGGPAVSAGLSGNKGVAVDAAGNLYIADSGNNRVREVLSNGTIVTVAGIGSGNGIATGDGGPATGATVDFPYGVTVSRANVYIADTGDNQVRLLTPVAPAP